MDRGLRDDTLIDRPADNPRWHIAVGECDAAVFDRGSQPKRQGQAIHAIGGLDIMRRGRGQDGIGAVTQD